MTTDEKLRQIRRANTMDDAARARAVELRAEGRSVREISQILRDEALADDSYPTVWRELFADDEAQPCPTSTTA